VELVLDGVPGAEGRKTKGPPRLSGVYLPPEQNTRIGFSENVQKKHISCEKGFLQIFPQSIDRGWWFQSLPQICLTKPHLSEWFLSDMAILR
jgi:hypothetical protein